MMFEVKGRSCKGLETLKDDFLRFLWCYDVPLRVVGRPGGVKRVKRVVRRCGEEGR